MSVQLVHFAVLLKQRRCSGWWVLERREVLMRVRMLVLVVVLMELEGEWLNAGLVLGRPV